MINRENWKMVRAYLQYRREVDLICSSSQRLEETWLRHLLEWSDGVSFEQVVKVRPAYPKYLLSLSLSPVYTTHILRSSHRFFRWLVKHERGYTSISAAWLDTLKVPGMVIEHADHEFVTFDEICAISRRLLKLSESVEFVRLRFSGGFLEYV